MEKRVHAKLDKTRYIQIHTVDIQEQRKSSTVMS